MKLLSYTKKYFATKNRKRDFILAGIATLFVLGLPLTVTLINQQQNLKSQAQVVSAGSALRFTGSGTANVNRVNIPLDNPERPVDIGATDFTIEWWMLVNPGEITNNEACRSGSYNWVNGDIIVDRDINSNGDYGDFGVSLYGGGLAFGVGNTTSDNTICGSAVIADGQWHHIAVTRERANGIMRIFVDGNLDAQGNGPTGDISYRNNRSGNTWDPYLVLGAEKHNFVAPQFRGILDEMRISNSLRYNTNFTRPSSVFASDINTVALYHFDEGSGVTVNDFSTAGGGPSTGTIAIGGNPQGPVWVTSTAPIAGNPNATPVPTAPLISTPTPTASPTISTAPGGQNAAAVAYGFDEGSGTAASDSSGNNLTGTITGASWNSNGRYGSGLSFNGTTSRVTSPALTLAGPFTMMAWINNPGASSYETVMTVGSNRDIFLTNNVPYFYDGFNEFAFGGALSTNTWHHLAFVYDGTVLRLYVNGTQQGTSQPLSLGTVTAPLQIGAWVQGTTSYDYFSGLIDEPRIYGRALSQAEVQSALNAPLGGNIPVPATATPVQPTPTPLQTQSITLNPVADAYVNNASTTTRNTNYGTSTVLNIDSSPVNIGYMRFDLSSLAGREIVSAILRIRTSTDFSNNQQRVKPVTNTTWSETGITFANRPAVTNTVLGTINSANAQNAWQQVNITSTVTANVGRFMSLAIDTGGSDNIWFWSRESASRPELVIQVR